MRKKKFALLGVCTMLCLLIMSAMSGSLLGYSNAWFTSSAQANASIAANFLNWDEIVEVNLPDDFTCAFGKQGKPFIIGSIKALTDSVQVKCAIEPELVASLIKQIKPVFPVVLKQNKCEEIELYPEKKHGVAPGTYLGQLVFTFTYGDKTFTKVVNLTIVIPD